MICFMFDIQYIVGRHLRTFFSHLLHALTPAIPLLIINHQQLLSSALEITSAKSLSVGLVSVPLTISM